MPTEAKRLRVKIEESAPVPRTRPDFKLPDGRKPRVLFVNPPSIPYAHLVKALTNCYYLEQVVAMPMGILYLAATLERDFPGIDMRVVDLARAVNKYNDSPVRQSVNIQEFAAFVLKDQVPEDFVPDVIGLSILFSTAHKSSLHIAAALKERWPGAPIVIGGMHATNAVEALLESRNVDYVCRGEAESIISSFVQSIIEKGVAEGIPGIVDRTRLDTDRRGALAESAPLINNLDEIPFPAWHLLPMDEYVYAKYSRSKRIDTIAHDGEATVVTTRGCPFHCTFCASWTVHGRLMRYRSIDNVLKELEILKERYKISWVMPEDDLFTVNKPRIIELCNAIADRFKKTLHFQFSNGLSVATLDEDVIRAMINMGMTLANIAVESGSPYVQRHIIKKNCKLDRARRVVSACRELGARVRVFFIFGFPGETREMMQETIDFAHSLPSDWTVFSVAAPLIGTEMHQEMIDAGWIDANYNWDEAFFQERTFDTKEISAKDLKDLVYDANIMTNFFNNYNMRIGEFDRALMFFTDVLRCYESHLVCQYSIGKAYEAMGRDGEYEEAMRKCRALIEKGFTLAKQQYAQYSDLMPEIAGEAEPLDSVGDAAASRARPLHGLASRFCKG